MKKIPVLLIWFGVVLLIMGTGVIGYMFIEQYGFFDALYMTVTTIATIGYFEVKPLSENGRIFNIIYIIISFSTFTFALTKLTGFFLSGEMQLYFKNRRIMSTINKLNQHVIICGFGRNGQQTANTLRAHKVDFVVIDHREKNIEDYIQQFNFPNLAYIHGDATDDAVLQLAGIDRAKSLICALPTDADNVFIVLSARSLNNQIRIISRASNASSVIKLRKAGADSVIMPDKIGGTHMANLVSKPDVIEFIDYLSGEEGESINIEAVPYEKLPNEIKDKSLQIIMDWKKTGVNCIGIKDSEGKFIINPPNNIIISKGMKVIVLGSREQIGRMHSNVEYA